MERKGRNSESQSDYEDFSTRRVTRSQPSTWIGPSAGRSFSSARLLIQDFTDVAALQSSFAVLDSPEAPNRRTIHADRSSLGLRVIARTSAGSIFKSGVRRFVCDAAGFTMRGCESPMAKRLAAAASCLPCGRIA